jgi:MoxR-like ATPase
VNETRRHSDVYLGASPRGSLAIYTLARARAALAGRAYVLPDDVKAVAAPALAHRLILRRGAASGRTPAEELVQSLLDRLPVPGTRPDPRPGTRAGTESSAGDVGVRT